MSATDALQAIADGDRLLTTGEAAAMIRVERATIVRWCKAGKLESVRTLGGHRRIWLSEMQKALKGSGG